MRIYQAIYRQLEADIKLCFKAGDYLPPEMQLAARFQVNRHTVRRAIDELVINGFIQRHQGKGNMVLHQPQLYKLQDGAHFTGNLVQQGASPSCQVIRARLMPVTSRLLHELQLGDQALVQQQKIIHIQTLRRTEYIPHSIIHHYFSDPQWWSVLKQFQYGSLHDFLKLNLNVELKRISTRLGARIPTGEESRLLQINKSMPVMRIKTKHQLKGTEQMAEFSVSSARSDLIEYVVEH
ncbi:phosphonate metabolism transcriptional regulator PhnF [Oceanisphaera sp. IT1-181]|uniref:phosphonate metabolism transcriptional regulator PhnF n=1 Tax=Oceanisphaera sp. IT1-181 TaxID=3081199 RepID=UPI0029C9D6F2|nr:phosphonate metabolism transcriptional regulator PhnF [Oceanisphaera sp. IT1-181]